MARPEKSRSKKDAGWPPRSGGGLIRFASTKARCANSRDTLDPKRTKSPRGQTRTGKRQTTTIRPLRGCADPVSNRRQKERSPAREDKARPSLADSPRGPATRRRREATTLAAFAPRGDGWPRLTRKTAPKAHRSLPGRRRSP